MYKIVTFLPWVLDHIEQLFLGSFDRFFRKLRRKKILTSCHVLKTRFSGNF